jgi:hypothetical protein
MSRTKVHQDESLFAAPQPITRIEEVRSGYSHREPCQTEARAAVAVRPVSGKRRRQVMQHIADAGFTGITRQEIADLHGIKLQSVCSAVFALKDGGFVRQLDRERSGGSVLIATERGFRALARTA